MLVNAGIVSSGNVTSFLSGDPFASNVVLYLKGDGTNGSKIFIDESPFNRPLTLIGTQIEIQTSQSKYGGSSVRSTTVGSTSSIQVPNSNDFYFTSTDNYTIEFWVYCIGGTSSNTYGFIGNSRIAGNTGYWVGYLNNTQELRHRINGTTTNIATLPLNSWNHIAIVQRANLSLVTYLNGINVNSISPVTIASNSENFFILNVPPNATNRGLNTYMDSLRLTKAARYTANFNPETDTFLDI